MNDTPKQQGRPPVYPLGALAVGEYFEWPVPTGKDVIRMAKNVSQHGLRHDRGYRCKTDRTTRIMRVTRLR